jgi:replicative DNA helicase
MAPESSKPATINEFCSIGAYLLSFNSDSKEAANLRVGMMDTLRPEMFSETANRDIWSSLRVGMLSGENTDLVLLASRLRASGKLADVGGAEYLARMVEETPNWGNGIEYAKNVLDQWKRRVIGTALKQVSREVETHATDQPMDAMLAMDKAFRAVCETSDGATIELLMSYLDEAMHMRPQLEAPIVTRIAKLDGNINLFTPGELTILAARPSIGKSSLARQMCANAAVRGDILIFSMEVPNDVLCLQFSCEMAKVPFHDYRRGAVTEDQILNVARSSEDPNLNRIHVYDGGQPTVMDVAMALTTLKVRGREVAAVIIDYLGLMKHDRAERHDIAVGNTTRGLKQLAIQRKVPIILLAQLNREVERRGGDLDCDRPRLADLRDSGNIEQDADNVVFLWRKEREDQYLKVEPRVLTVAKHRNGEVFEVDLMFDKPAGRFYEVAPVDTSAILSEGPEDFYKRGGR